MRYHIFIIALLCCNFSFAQGWVYSEEFKTDFLTVNQDKGEEMTQFIDCKNNKSCDAWGALYNTRKNGIESVVHKNAIINPTDIYKKVAAKVASASPEKKTSINSSSEAQKQGKNYNYQTSPQAQAWRKQKMEQIQADRRKAAEIERQKKIAEKIAENNRATAATAIANTKLNVQTQKRIAEDHWNAGEGAEMALNRVQSAVNTVGVAFNVPTAASSTKKIDALRSKNKPRPVMNENEQDTVSDAERSNAFAIKKQLAYTRRAVAVNNAKNDTVSVTDDGITGSHRFQLSPHATSTLGNNWVTEPLTTPPPPSIKRKMTKEEARYLYIVELIDNRPLTSAEKAYFDKLEF